MATRVSKGVILGVSFRTRFLVSDIHCKGKGNVGLRLGEGLTLKHLE